MSFLFLDCTNSFSVGFWPVAYCFSFETSDVSKLKEYATGQKPTLKEFVQSKKRKDKARRITEGGEAEVDAVIERQGEFIENDLVDLDPPDLASGGIARMLGE